MSRMHKADENNGGTCGGEKQTTCPICGEEVSAKGKPKHIMEHGAENE